MMDDIDNYSSMELYWELTKDLAQDISVTNTFVPSTNLRRVWRYQRGNQNPYIDEKQTTQWPKEKIQTTIYKTYT